MHYLSCKNCGIFYLKDTCLTLKNTLNRLNRLKLLIISAFFSGYVLMNHYHVNDLLHFKAMCFISLCLHHFLGLQLPSKICCCSTAYSTFNNTVQKLMNRKKWNLSLQNQDWLSSPACIFFYNIPYTPLVINNICWFKFLPFRDLIS